MTELDQFITDHREVIDATIRDAAPYLDIDNEERRLWVLNDEYLYNLALAEGVEI